MKASAFDREYYDRFYRRRGSRVVEPDASERLGDFVCCYTRYLGVRVRRVLDVGCGLGLWQPVVARHFPKARFTGVEYSEYLCEQYGWTQGSVVDYAAKTPFDLVICQGVLPYLDDKSARAALRNLARLCSGVLYLEAVTSEDYRRGVIDTKRTDGAMQRRPASFYRTGLAGAFVPVGGGVFVRKTAGVPLFALEQQ